MSERPLVMYPQFQAVVKGIERWFESGSKYGFVEHLRLFGSTGVRKSTVVRLFKSRYPINESGNRTVIPVLDVTVPSDPSSKKLLGVLLRALGDPAPEKGDQWGRLLLLVSSRGVKIIIIDEIQHLVDKGPKTPHAQAAEKLKELEEALRVPMVFVGAPRAEELFTVNPQLWRRTQAPDVS